MILFAFSEEPFDLSAPLSRARHGLPTQFSMDELDIRQHRREEAPEWFDGFFSPELMNMAASDLGEDVDLSRMKAVCSLHLEAAEPTDLAYLQGTWAVARWLCECGAEVVHDAHAIRWHSGADLLELDPARGFEIEHEVNLIFESDETPGFGHVTHTRGLAKFGRPDIVLAGVQPDDARVCGVLLNALARRAALGAALHAGQTVGPAGLSPRTLVEYEPDEAHPQVNLNNDGLVLDVTDWGLSEL